MGDRGVAPVVGKVLEVGVVLVYVGIVAGALYGSAVPGYRTLAGDEVGERAVETVAREIEASVPATGDGVGVAVRVSVPDRIRGRTYAIRVRDGTLVLDHPRAGVSARRQVVVSDRVVDVRGELYSDRAGAIRVRQTPAGLVVELGVAA